jgi:hypothetical protein
MRHGTVRIKLLITGKSTLRKRAPPTHSVAAITLGCPRSSPRFPPLPGQPVSRPARPPAAAARTPCDFLCAPRPPVRPTAAVCVPARAAAASTPYCRLHAPQPPARSAAAARAPRRGRRPHAPLPPARPAVGCTSRGRPCAPWPPVRPAAARAPHYRRLRARSRSGRQHALLPPARPAAARALRGRRRRRTPPTRPAASCAPCSLPHASRPPARPVAARMPRCRPCAPRPPPARPAADAAHTPRCRLRAPLSAARPAAARAPLGRPHAPRPPFCPTAPQPAAHARLGGLGGGCRRAGRRRRCPPRLPLYRRRVHAAGHSGLGAGGREGVAEAGVGLQGDLALSVASARRTAQYADTRAVTRCGLRVPRRAGSERCRGGA